MNLPPSEKIRPCLVPWSVGIFCNHGKEPELKKRILATPGGQFGILPMYTPEYYGVVRSHPFWEAIREIIKGYATEGGRLPEGTTPDMAHEAYMDMLIWEFLCREEDNA